MRFPAAATHDPSVDEWLQADNSELREIARKWFKKMRQCGEDVRELIHDGCPVACVGDLAFCYVNTFSNHTNVGFFLGTELADPCHLMEGTGKRMRHVKLRPDETVDEEALASLIEAAYLDAQDRLRED